jgi:hypothetical protein
MGNATASLWYGFFRQSKAHRWLKLAEADDYGAALNALLNATKTQPKGGELLVTQTDPNNDGTARKPRRRY